MTEPNSGMTGPKLARTLLHIAYWAACAAIAWKLYDLQQRTIATLEGDATP